MIKYPQRRKAITLTRIKNVKDKIEKTQQFVRIRNAEESQNVFWRTWLQPTGIKARTTGFLNSREEELTSK